MKFTSYDIVQEDGTWLLYGVNGAGRVIVGEYATKFWPVMVYRGIAGPGGRLNSDEPCDEVGLPAVVEGCAA